MMQKACRRSLGLLTTSQKILANRLCTHANSDGGKIDKNFEGIGLIILHFKV
jgi:hypothetical protein